ncbi:MAG: ORF6N domain-containing protein, partial [Bacteroidota bacterium]
FPLDFMLELTSDEKEEVVTNCDHLKKLKFSPNFPKAFTEHGTLMLASVLNSPRAVEASVYVVRAFVRLREVLASHKDLAQKLKELESKFEGHDEQIRDIIEAINQLLLPPEKPKKQIGF